MLKQQKSTLALDEGVKKGEEETAALFLCLNPMLN
jgi:hypothetical protein